MQRESAALQGANFLFFAVVIVAWLAAGFLGLRNLRRAQVDRRGALRIALFVLATCTVTLLLRAHHPGGLAEFAINGKIEAYALFLSIATWFGYIAIEPFLRRR